MATLEQIMRKKIKQLERDLEISSNQVAKTVEKKFKEKIEEDVYSRPPSVYYERSRGLINSTTYLVSRKASSVYISVFIEPTLMGYTPFTEHSSWVTGSDERENVPFYVNYGHGGIVSNSPTLFLENTIHQLNMDKTHVKQLKEELKKLNYTVI